jgi:hypothetical protein
MCVACMSTVTRNCTLQTESEDGKDEFRTMDALRLQRFSRSQTPIRAYPLRASSSGLSCTDNRWTDRRSAAIRDRPVRFVRSNVRSSGEPGLSTPLAAVLDSTHEAERVFSNASFFGPSLLPPLQTALGKAERGNPLHDATEQPGDQQQRGSASPPLDRPPSDVRYTPSSHSRPARPRCASDVLPRRPTHDAGERRGGSTLL